MSQLVESSRYPYLPVVLDVGGIRRAVEALLDTGFDGDIAVPQEMAGDFRARRRRFLEWTLADGSVVRSPAYYGTVRIGELPAVPAAVIALGGEVILGRRIAARYLITLDRGRRVLIEQ